MAITWITRGLGLPEPSEPYELAHTTEEDWSLNTEQFSARASLKCAWSERHATLYNILAAGHAWPYFDSSGELRAVTGKISPMDGASSADGYGNSYELAKIDIDYKIVTFQSETQAMYSEELTPNLEMLSLPNYLFKWGSGPWNNKAWLLTHKGVEKPVTEDELQEQFTCYEENGVTVCDTIRPNPAYTEVTEEEAPSRKMYGFDYVVNWFNMLYIPTAYLNVNMVNYGPVYSPSLGVTFPSGTLLLNSSRAGRTVSFGGTNRYQVEARWSYNPQTWNKFWRVRKMEYEQLYIKATSDEYYNYPSTSFSGLLP